MQVRIESLELAPAAPGVVVQSGPVPDERPSSGASSGPAAGVGSRMTISFRVVPGLPFRGTWVARIVEVRPLEMFQDIQESGPMESWRHTHLFRRETRDGVNGTVIRDEVEYELPFGVLGRIADALFVARMMQSAFRSRQRTLEGMIR